MRLGLLVAVGMLLAVGRVEAQAGDGMMSDAEVESLRDAAFVPVERLSVYVKIMDVREKEIDSLLAKRRYPGREQDLHDLMEQMAGIADELNDNLDEYRKGHRDVRKVLPKLVMATERWATALRAPVEDKAYDVERKIALDDLKDMRAEAEEMETELAGYFKEHPEALKVEKARTSDPHAATAGDGAR